MLVAEGVDIAALQRRTCGAEAHEDDNGGHVVAHTQSAATLSTAALATAQNMDVLTASDSESDSPPATPRPRGSLQRRRSCAGANASAASSAASALGAVAAAAVFATRARRASCATNPSQETCAASVAAAQEQGEAPSKVSGRRSSLAWAAAAAATTVVAAETGTAVQEAAPAIRTRRRSFCAGTQPAAVAAEVAATLQGAAPAIRIRRRSTCAGAQPAAVAAEVVAATAVAAATATAAAAATEVAAAEAAAAEATEVVAAAPPPPPTVSFKPHRPTAEIFLAAMVGAPSAPPPALRSSWEAPADDGAPEQAETESGEAEAAASGTGLTRGGGAGPLRRRCSISPCGGTAASHGQAEVTQGSHSAMLLRRNEHEEECAAEGAFRRFDTDGDGSISRVEFIALLTVPSASRPPLTPDEIERLFVKLDLDGNGSIDLREFGQAWAESSGDLAALVPMTAEMQAAQEAAAQAAAAEQAAAEQATALEAAAQEAVAQETARRNAKTSRYLRRSSTVAAFPSTVVRDAVAAAAAAGAAVAEAPAADAAAKSSAYFPATKSARRRVKSTANLRPSPLLLRDDEGSDDADEGTGLHQIDLTALTETNDTGASETATSDATCGAAADGAYPPRGASLSPLSPPRSRLWADLRTSASERASGVSGGGYVVSSARSLASKAKAYQIATTVEEMLAVRTLGSPRQQGAPSPVRRSSTPTSPASAAPTPPKGRRCLGSSGPRPGSAGSCRAGPPTSPLASPPQWQRLSASPGSCRAGQQSPSSPRLSPSPLLTRSYHVQPHYHGPQQPRSTSPRMPPRSASVQDMGRHRLRYQPKDVAWERTKRTNGATPTARLLPQVEVRPAFASLDALDALAHENEPPQPLLAQLLQQVDSHVDGSYEHWFLPRKYTTTPAALISWRDGR